MNNYVCPVCHSPFHYNDTDVSHMKKRNLDFFCSRNFDCCTFYSDTYSDHTSYTYTIQKQYYDGKIAPFVNIDDAYQFLCRLYKLQAFT